MLALPLLVVGRASNPSQVSNLALILLLAVFAGLLAGLLRASYRKCKLYIPHLDWVWLVPVAFILQWLALRLPSTSNSFPAEIIPIGLVGTQILLLAFAWTNRSQPGFWMLGLGLGLNFFVIGLNGGLMPISPETVASITDGVPAGTWEVGQRFSDSKDIVLPVTGMRLGLFSDRFLLPDWVPYRVAFSLGDVLIGLGAFTLMWSLGGCQEPVEREKKEQ